MHCTKTCKTLRRGRSTRTKVKSLVPGMGRQVGTKIACNEGKGMILIDSPCARSEKRPRNEVSFRVPGNICFFALMGRKHDAEVEFTCCRSQKSAKVGFSKGFLSDLIGPDRVVDIFRGQPARRRWQDDNYGDFVKNNACGRGVMTKTERSACSARGFSCYSLTQEHVRRLLPAGRAERRVLVLLNVEQNEDSWRHRQHNSVKKASEDRRR